MLENKELVPLEVAHYLTDGAFNREFVVVDDEPYYCSTGSNSGMPNALYLSGGFTLCLAN